MSLTFGPTLIALRPYSADQVTVTITDTEIPATLSAPVTLNEDAEVSFTVAQDGRYTVTVTRNGTSHSVHVVLTADEELDLETIGDIRKAIEDLAAASGGSVTWGSIDGKPTTFPPSTHTHTIAQVTALQTALDGKQDSGSYATTSALTSGLAGKAATTHTHTAAQISDGTATGRSVLTAASASAARAAIGAGTGDGTSDLVLGTTAGTALAGNGKAATAGAADTAAILATGRTIGITGDVVGTSTAFNGSAPVSFTTSIGAGVIVNADVSGSAAIAGSKITTASTGARGVVNQAAAQADSVAADAPALVTDFNALLAKLRTAGLIA